MKIRIIAVWLLVLTGYVFLFVPAWSLTIVLPPENTFVENDAVHLVMQNDNKKINAYQVMVNNYSYPKANSPADKQYIYPEIFLAPGLNTITVTSLAGKDVVATHELEVFLQDFSNRPSRKTKKYLFHIPENEKKCSACHRMVVELDDISPDEPADSPCFTCHKGKLESTFVHSPAEEWTCLECHLTKKGQPKYSLGGTVIDLCYTCHGNEISGWREQKVMHGPTAVGQCTLCHNPHGSDWPSLVKLHASDLCVKCHEDKATGTHVTAGFYGKGHPTRGVPDPRDKSREFSCASCHNPHGGDNNKLLNFSESANGMHFCQNCHNM